MKKIVVLSGGGAKGVLQTAILKELELRGELSDVALYTGSSVGAINSSMLASGKMNAKTLFEIYPEMTKRVFKKRSKLFNGIRPPIYDRQNFINIWDYYIGKNMLMSEVKTPLVITSVEMCNKDTVFHKSYKQEYNEFLLDVVLKSFAAPLYFGYYIDNDEKMIYADGGMTSSNLPLMHSFLEALSFGWTSEPVKIIAIGCGYSNDIEDFDKVKDRGVFWQLSEFMRPTDGGLARKVSRVDQINSMKFIAKTMSNISFDYYDIQIPKDLDKMDNLDALSEYIRYGIEASQTPLISI